MNKILAPPSGRDSLLPFSSDLPFRREDGNSFLVQIPYLLKTFFSLISALWFLSLIAVPPFCLIYHYVCALLFSSVFASFTSVLSNLIIGKIENVLL